VPINVNAIGSSPEPEEQPSAEAPTRKRRTKAELIADAVVPAHDEIVVVKDKGTGAKIERHWGAAVELFRDGKIDWPDNVLKYAFLKYEQERAAGVFAGDPADPSTDEQQVPVEQAEEKPLVDTTTQLRVVPPDAEVGDEVSIGSETFRVGHGPVLVDGSSRISIDGEIVKPKRRWIREIGSGPNGPWEATDPLGGIKRADKVDHVGEMLVKDTPAESNGHSDEPVQVETQRLPRTQEPQDDNTIKITTGILEKIGMPQVEQFASASQMQVGPISISRTVVDDGRRTTVDLADGRTGEVITSVVEGFELLDNTAEFVAARFRGQLVAFLQATGALKQPVSA
jgi:hypothetical protein